MNYKIKSGDTLSGIAKTYGTTTDELARINNIENKNLIRAGATITIPDNNAGVPVSPATTAQNGQNGAEQGNTTPSVQNTPVTLKSQINGVDDATYTAMMQNPSKSQSVLNAMSALEAANAKIQEGKTKWSDTLDDAVNQLLGIGKFSYNPANDPMFQQNLESYQQMGQMAAKDTLAKASALTGGYSSSAGQNVAQQAYNSYLQRGFDNLPEYYDLALSAYNAENDRLQRNYGLISAEDEREMDKLREGRDIEQANFEREYGLAQDDVNRALQLADIQRGAWEYDDEVKRADVVNKLNSDYSSQIELLNDQVAQAQNQADYYTALYELKDIKKPEPNGGGGYLYGGKAYSEDYVKKLFAEDVNKILDKYNLTEAQIEAIYNELGI